jgi:hypothetical protein
LFVELVAASFLSQNRSTLSLWRPSDSSAEQRLHYSQKHRCRSLPIELVAASFLSQNPALSVFGGPRSHQLTRDSIAVRSIAASVCSLSLLLCRSCRRIAALSIFGEKHRSLSLFVELVAVSFLSQNHSTLSLWRPSDSSAETPSQSEASQSQFVCRARCCIVRVAESQNSHSLAAL